MTSMHCVMIYSVMIIGICVGDINHVRANSTDSDDDLDDQNQESHDKYGRRASDLDDLNRRKTRKARKAYLDSIYKDELAIDSTDKKDSGSIVKVTVDNIRDKVRLQDGGKIYKADVRKAGSHAINSKISKADEFDKNIILDVKVENVRTSGELPYAYADKKSKTKGVSPPVNMNADRDLVDGQRGTIPAGHASVEVSDSTPGYLTHKGDLIPHKVKKDLYKKVNKAIEELHLKNVQLLKYAHGPALTLKIKRDGQNDIDVDLTASVPWDGLSVTDDGWPRPETKKAYTQKQIDAVIKAGMHLVPKGDETWVKSYSNAENALFKTVDEGNGCRTIVLKHLKRYAQEVKSVPGGLPGFSSHILKHQVLWSSEKRSEPEYWHAKNVDECLIDTMADTERSLRAGKLPDYFNPSQNILAERDQQALIRMADFLKKERMKLVHM